MAAEPMNGGQHDPLGNVSVLAITPNGDRLEAHSRGPPGNIKCMLFGVPLILVWQLRGLAVDLVVE